MDEMTYIGENTKFAREIKIILDEIAVLQSRLELLSKKVGHAAKTIPDLGPCEKHTLERIRKSLHDAGAHDDYYLSDLQETYKEALFQALYREGVHDPDELEQQIEDGEVSLDD